MLGLSNPPQVDGGKGYRNSSTPSAVSPRGAQRHSPCDLKSKYSQITYIKYHISVIDDELKELMRIVECEKIVIVGER